MTQILAIAIGGALGALARYWTAGLIAEWGGRDFPWGTLFVNITGSFLIGICYLVVLQKLHLNPEIKSILVVGFLGAFTTFSTFSLETFSMLERGQWLTALAYIGSSVILCVLAVGGGYLLARILVTQS